jgi:hypothetical protein
MRLLLPTPIGRSRLRAFWALLSVVLGLILGGFLVAPGDAAPSTAFVSALVLTLVVALPGLVRPYAVQWAYRGWNFAARRVARYVERYVTFVCFATVVVASSLGSPVRTFERSPDRGSMWFARGTQASSTYPSQDARPGSPPASSSWSSDFRRWARSSSHPAAVVLLPFLALLRAVSEDGAETATNSNIYTLY